MSKKIPVNNYVNHLDLSKSHHIAFLQAVLDRVNELDPESLQEGGDLRSIWKAAVETKAPLIQQPTKPVSGGQPGLTWQGMEAMARAAGARYPELVAAQFALESDWGKKLSGKNNFFGLKGAGSVKKTEEFINGKWVSKDDSFIDFASPEEAVKYLVDRWYKDFKSYKGVNNAADRNSAATMLRTEKYATGPKYDRLLIELMDENSPIKSATPIVIQQSSVSPANALKADVKQWRTRVRALNLSQPDASTCQAACIAMAVGDKNIAGIRSRLLAAGNPGKPSVMSKIIKTYKNVNYILDENASLEKVCTWLKNGELLITHGWFTNSGHVIILDGLAQNPATKGYSYDVKDPWSEFDGPSWSYKKSSKFFDGFYSEYIIYAACVAGSSAASAASIYKTRRLDMKRGGMWVHRFAP